ncbi:chondroitin sulfate proteoglycan 5 isoform X1 [Natator depressus]|uniref:chondroitin sulfate proteoglycan 5 isoform X1 n=1 Tax=Natator depressus TaxID=27790 RepID=UPI003EBAF9C3
MGSAAGAAGGPRRRPALLLALALLLAASPGAAPVSKRHPERQNAMDAPGAGWEGPPSPPDRGREQDPKSGELLRNVTAAGENSYTVEPSEAARVKESWRQTPADLPGLAAEGLGTAAAASADQVSGLAGAGISVRYYPGGISEENNEPSLCLGCPGGVDSQSAWPPKPLLAKDNEGAMEASSAVTSVAWSVNGEAVVLALSDTKGALESSIPVPESQEEAGSGDQPARASPGGMWNPGAFVELTVTPSADQVPMEMAGAASSSAGPGLSSDSAEKELLLEAFREMVLQPPTPDGRAPELGTQTLSSTGLAQDSAQKEEPLELWLVSSSNSPAQGALGHTDLTWLTTEVSPGLQLAVTPPVDALKTSEPPSDQLVSEIIDIDYYDLFDGESQGRGGGLEDFPARGPGGADSPKRKPDDKTTSWAIHELYDDFTPFDESDFYPTTSFYTDGDEDGEDDELDEEEEEEDGGGGLARDLEDENNSKLPTPATPKIQTTVQEAESTSRRYVIPPLQTFVVSGGSATSRPRPAETSRDLSQSAMAAGPGGENGTECRSGYVRHNNSCKSVCDIFPSYCHNGGHCYLVEGLGAFCRCNTQDYIWHKGIRCESIITDFQVMCVAVGSAALVVLLLFMMTVFFAKKLYLLKTENNKLRKTKYRTPSELHNDNFSLSTIAEGSHPNVRKLCNTPCNLSPHARALAYYDNVICQDDPNAPHKLQDSLKSCMKEEESFNIQNSMSPKHDNGKGEQDESGVNCLQNNLT